MTRIRFDGCDLSRGGAPRWSESRSLAAYAERVQSGTSRVPVAFQLATSGSPSRTCEALARSSR